MKGNITAITIDYEEEEAQIRSWVDGV